MAPPRRREHIPQWIGVAAVFLAMATAALLVLVGIDNHKFWDDEAATAIYARNLIEQGKLTAWDGTNLIAYNYGGGLGEDLGYERRIPALPVYVAALGMRLFEDPTFGGRILFALAGVLGVGLLAVWVRRHLGRRFPWFLPSIILALSPAYLLYVRNCRYFALSVLFSLLVWAIWAPGTHRPRRRQANWFDAWSIARYLGGAAAIVLVLWSHYLSGAAVLVTLPIFFLDPRYRQRRQYVLLGVIYATAAVYGTWTLWTANPLGTDYVVRGAEFMAGREASYFKRTVFHLGWLIRDLGTHEFFPWLLLGVLAAAWLPRYRRCRPLARRGVLLLGLTLVYVLLAALLSPAEMAKGPTAEMRYVVPLIAVGCVVAAIALVILWRIDRPLAMAATVLLIATNLLHLGFLIGRADGRSRVGSTLARYVWDISHDYRTGNEALIDLLNQLPQGTTVRVLPQQLVYPAMFYVPKLHYCDQLTESKKLLPELRDELPDYVFVERSQPDVILVPEPYLKQTLRDLDKQYAPGTFRIAATTPGFWHFTSKAEIPGHYFSMPERNWQRYPGMVALVRNTAPAKIETALEVAPDDADAYYRMGKLMDTLGRRSEAIAHYRHALDLMPESAPLRIDLARALREEGQREEAWNVYRRVFGRPIPGRKTWHRLEVEVHTDSDWSDVRFVGFPYIFLTPEEERRTLRTLPELDKSRLSDLFIALETSESKREAEQEVVLYLQWPEYGEPRIVVRRGDDGATRVVVRRDGETIIDYWHNQDTSAPDDNNRIEIPLPRDVLLTGTDRPSLVDSWLRRLHLPAQFLWGAWVSAAILLAGWGLLRFQRLVPWSAWRTNRWAMRSPRQGGPWWRSPLTIRVAAALALNVPFVLCHPVWLVSGAPVVRSLAINLVLFLVPGMPLVGALIGRGRLKRFGLLWAMAFSMAVFLTVLLVRRLTGLPLTPAVVWNGTWIVTNLGILLCLWTGGPPAFGACRIGKHAWLGLLVFAVAYGAFFYGATDLVPAMEDHGYEVQGTGYGLLARFEPRLLTDRNTELFFAHPPLLHFYVAGSFLYYDELNHLAVYDEASQRVRQMKAGEKIEPPDVTFCQLPNMWIVRDREGIDPALPRNRVVGVDGVKYLVETPLPDQYVRVWAQDLEVKLLYDHYRMAPHRLATRTPNIFLAALGVAILAVWVARSTDCRWLGLLVPLMYATSPEVFVRSCYGGYFAISNFAVILMLIAAERWMIDRRRSAWLDCVLAGGLAALANHKLALLPIAMFAWLLLRPGQGLLWRRDVKSALHPCLMGFAAGTLIFWAYGLVISPTAFCNDHLTTHLLDRVMHHNPLGYTGYPTLPGLWLQFCEHTGYLLLPLGLAAMVALCLGKENRRGGLASIHPPDGAVGWRGIPGLWLIWTVLVAVAFSLIDWRQTKHLMPLMVPLSVAPARLAARNRSDLVVVSLLLAALAAWNLAMLRGMAVDFAMLEVTPTW